MISQLLHSEIEQISIQMLFRFFLDVNTEKSSTKEEKKRKEHINLSTCWNLVARFTCSEFFFLISLGIRIKVRNVKAEEHPPFSSLFLPLMLSFFLEHSYMNFL